MHIDLDQNNDLAMRSHHHLRVSVGVQIGFNLILVRSRLFFRFF
jgi:hypothetical protein